MRLPGKKITALMKDDSLNVGGNLAEGPAFRAGNLV